MQVNLPAEPGQGQVLMGLASPISSVYTWSNLLQFLVPLAVGAAFLWREWRRAIVKA